MGLGQSPGYPMASQQRNPLVTLLRSPKPVLEDKFCTKTFLKWLHQQDSDYISNIWITRFSKRT